MTILTALPALLLAAAPPAAAPDEAVRLRQRASAVTITRDDWGIAHVRGKTDADAVFGMVYAQAEDDFNRIEINYLTALGRLAEAEGEKAIWRDLRARLYADPEQLRARYAASPDWLKRLMIAWADGLNHFLGTHKDVRPRVLTRFEPWMALSFTEGSIGADIERIDLKALEAFYSQQPGSALLSSAAFDEEPRGSNGFTIAPANTRNGKALLLINPHTSFFFRAELHMTSDEGLNAYGAATWGQFFIYQGFNERLGWMHTTSGLDAVDEFLERVEKQGERLVYRYGTETRPVEVSKVQIAVRQPDGTQAPRSFQVYRTHHGPVVREQDGRWVSVAMMHKPVEALQQSFLRTKAKDHAAFVAVAELKANSSNNTILADAKGNIAYLHPQFIPRREDRFDYRRPVDGSDPATDWRGLHATSEAPNLLNPQNGWIQNTNNWPYSAAGANSRGQAEFPRYMDSFGENPRGVNAVRVLGARKDFTLETLRDAAYDPYLPAFAELIPGLVKAWDAAPAGEARQKLAEPVALLRGWDHRWAADSVATSLAVFWGEEMARRFAKPHDTLTPYQLMAQAPDSGKLDALAAAIARLEADFGRWRTPWGEVNRFQRISPAIAHPFSDAAPSLPVGFASARWGSLASFGARPYPGTKRWYGNTGNSFVAVVEFGDKVRARAVTAGGVSGDPKSPHFNDQARRYATGDLREVYFYPEQLKAHARRTYRPGQ